MQTIGCMMTGLFYALVVFTVPMIAYGEEAVETLPVDPSDFIKAIAERNWPLLVALVCTFIVFFVRKIAKEKIPTKYAAWVALLLAVVGASAGRVIEACSTGIPWWHGLVRGVVEGIGVGLMSMGWWSIGVKRIRRATSGF